MTHEDMIRMAREAKLFQHVPPNKHVLFIYDILTFAVLIEAQEREECAQVCDEIEMNGHALWKRTYDPDAQGRSTGAADCANAIRARREQ